MHGGRKSERRFGIAMNGNKPTRNLGEEDRTLRCSCQAQHDEAFIYGKEPDVPTIGYISQEKAPWLVPHHDSAAGLSGETCSGHPLSTYKCWAVCVRSSKGLQWKENPQRWCWGMS